MRKRRDFPYAVILGIAAQFALATIVTAALLKARVSSLPNSNGQILNALTAIAQVLASLLGLLLAVALVVAQLTSSYSRTTSTNLIIRPTLVISVLYTIAIAMSVALSATARPTQTQAIIALAFSFLCLFLIVPFFLLLKRQLSVESAVRHLLSLIDRAIRRRDQPSILGGRLRHVLEYGVAAASERDLNAYSAIVTGLTDVALDAERFLGQEQTGQLLATMTTITGQAAGDWILSAVAIHGIEASIRGPGILGGSERVVAQVLSRLLRPLVVSLVLNGPHDEHGTESPINDAIELLRDIGRQSSALGDSTTTAAAVVALAEVKLRASERNQRTVAGRSSRALASVGRPCTDTTPSPYRDGAKSPSSSYNLLLNGGFEFGHDPGYGREPGWFSPLSTGQIESRALRTGSGGSTKWTMRLRADVVGAVFAQDVVQEPSAGDTFILFGRLSTDGSPGLARLALWALGGIEERGVTNVRLDSAYFSVIATQLDVRFPGHYGLRAQVHLDRVKTDYHLDDVFLLQSLTRNGGFELGTLNCWQLTGSAQVIPDTSTPPWLGGEYVAMLADGTSLAQTLDPGRSGSPEADHLIVTLATRSDEPSASVAITVSAGEACASASARSSADWCRIVRVFPIPPGSDEVTLTLAARAEVLIDAVVAVAMEGSPDDRWSTVTAPDSPPAAPPVVSSGPYEMPRWLASPRNPLHVRRVLGQAVEPGQGFSALVMARFEPSAGAPADAQEVVTACLTGRDADGAMLSCRSACVNVTGSEWKLEWLTFDVDSWSCSEVQIEISCSPARHKVEIVIPLPLPLIETCGELYGSAFRTGDRG